MDKIIINYCGRNIIGESKSGSRSKSKFWCVSGSSYKFRSGYRSESATKSRYWPGPDSCSRPKSWSRSKSY